MKIILIGGQAQHGKDTSAEMLKDIFERDNKKVLIIRYGDYLKFVCKHYFGWNGVKDDHGRTVLQIYGTEKGRDRNPGIWAKVLFEFMKAFGEDFDYVIIPDFRYPDESNIWVGSEYDSFSLWVHRKDFDNGLTEEQKNHRSETSLLDFSFDYLISVESKSYKLREALERMVASKGFRRFNNK